MGGSVGFPGHQTLVTLSSPKQGCARGAARGEKRRGGEWGVRTEAELWSGCSCHVHYFAFKRSSKSKSPKALNEAKEPKREGERKREREREGETFFKLPPGGIWTFGCFNTFYVQNKCELMHFY